MNPPIPKKRSSQAVEPCAGSLPAAFVKENDQLVEKKEKKDKTTIDRIEPLPLEEQANPNDCSIKH